MTLEALVVYYVFFDTHGIRERKGGSFGPGDEAKSVTGQTSSSVERILGFDSIH